MSSETGRPESGPESGQERCGVFNRRDILKSLLAGSAGLATLGIHRAVLAGADLAATVEQPFLSEAQRKAISVLAELILPTTDTPGAIAAGVPEFIELMLSDWYTPDERQPVIAGLAELDSACQLAHGRDFLACDAAQQSAALAATEGGEFFKLFRELTVLGYYTSEVGVAAEADFNPMPMAYRGDVPISEQPLRMVN